MKVLLSAYACEPGKGSEPGVGWHWALEIARLGHEVWVLTRANNRETVEAGLEQLEAMPNLHFAYYDLPRWAKCWKKGERGVYLYYLLWQWGAYCLAKKLHAWKQFDCVQHITFVSVRQPSFMGNLEIPFIFGPVGGGEHAPWRLRFGYGLRGWLLEGLRDLLNLLVRFDPFMRRTFRQAERIYVTSEQTLALLPSRYQGKAGIQLAIGHEMSDIDAPSRGQDSHITSQQCIRVLYVGKFIYWKGMHLGLEAFALLVRGHPNAQLTMVGKGPEEQRWRNLAKRLGVQHHVRWVPWVQRDELLSMYESHDVLLFPSLHDSGGMVVLEAMAHRLPVVCLDLGGPGKTVNGNSGRAVVASNATRSGVIKNLAQALKEITLRPDLRKDLKLGALERTRSFSTKRLIRKLYSLPEQSDYDNA